MQRPQVRCGKCRFHLRCPVAFDKCTEVAPELTDEDGTLVRCLRYTEDHTEERSVAL